MPTHSSILAWKIPWTEEPGGLLVHRVAYGSEGCICIGSHRVQRVAKSQT